MSDDLVESHVKHASSSKRTGLMPQNMHSTTGRMYACIGEEARIYGVVIRFQVIVSDGALKDPHHSCLVEVNDQGTFVEREYL